MPKIQAENAGWNLLWKIAAETCCGNLLRKIAAEICCGKLLQKIAAEIQNSCAWQYTIELRRTLKSPRLVKFPRLWNYCASKISAPIQNLSGKVWRPLTIWARQNLQLLTSSKSGWRALVQILVESVDSQTCRPQVIWRLRPLCSASLPYCTGLLYRHDLSKFLRVSEFLRPHKFSQFLVKNQKFYLGF